MSTNEEPPSTLLSIPRELRDRIYHFTFADTEVTPRRQGIRVDVFKCCNSGLLAACKQLRTESMSPYYKLTTFDIGGYVLKRWVKHLQPVQCSLLRSIHVRLGAMDNGRARDWLDDARNTAESFGVRREAHQARFWDFSGESIWASRMPEGYDEQDDYQSGELV